MREDNTNTFASISAASAFDAERQRISTRCPRGEARRLAAWWHRGRTDPTHHRQFRRRNLVRIMRRRGQGFRDFLVPKLRVYELRPADGNGRCASGVRESARAYATHAVVNRETLSAGMSIVRTVFRLDQWNKLQLHRRPQSHRRELVAIRKLGDCSNIKTMQRQRQRLRVRVRVCAPTTK